MTVYRILVATYTDSLVTLLFDPSVPSLKVASTLKVGHHPSWLTSHPDDPSLVFTGLEQADGRILALRFDAAGRGKVVGSMKSGGADPASLLAVRGTLFVGNYSSGSVVTTPLSTTAPYFSDATSSAVPLSGTGPNKERQEASHPHHVVYVPELGELLVPDLGADKTWRLQREKEKWAVKGHVAYAAGSGPRHVVYHDGLLYTICELTSTLTSHRLSSLPSSASTLLSSTSTLTDPPPELGDRLAAELLYSSSPSATPHLYASNRNDPSPLGDTLSIFSLEKPGAPELVTEVRTGVKHLRGVEIGGEGGRWVVLGGAQGGGVKIYEKVDGGRGLKEIVGLPGVDSPTAFLWLLQSSQNPRLLASGSGAGLGGVLGWFVGRLRDMWSSILKGLRGPKSV
ncbi:putative isomerase YbhE [Artomyces pyxidatus]|uniref:Isomerase YbhE n=1 Tax=Artomyces pyxidatus TaxID=48021 RepID=A0ACB8T1I2_9AGAM|nr:putative isomerase YbhE [Artomyces pyxidatus]